MLRIWKGKEVEGFEQGKETLFMIIVGFILVSNCNY